MNIVFIVGRMGGDPTRRSTANGTTVVNFSICTEDYLGDKNPKHLEWHRCVAWGRMAETIANHVHKGDQLIVTGRLQSREWETKGSKQKTTEIIVDKFEFGKNKRVEGMGGKSYGGSRREDRGSPRGGRDGDAGDADYDPGPPEQDDLPF